MKDSPLVRTSTGTSFEASSAMGDAVNVDITDFTFSAIKTAKYLLRLSARQKPPKPTSSLKKVTLSG